MTSVLIVDDHPLVGDGISTMLKGEISLEVVNISRTGKDALDYLSSCMPAIILLDISLPDIDGLELCALIRKKNKDSKIIALTSTNEAGIISKFLAVGGNGYVLKNMERNELLLAIREVLAGDIYLSRAANQRLLEQFNGGHQAGKSKPVLTRREKEVLLLLFEGLNGPQIAARLYLSVLTVETHRKHLMQKYQVNSLQQLLKEAKGQGAIPA